jgi:hypothetical protein
MAKYNAYALVALTSMSSVVGRPQRVFFAKKDDDGGGFEEERLREFRLELAAKHDFDLIPVDLEVVDMSNLVTQVKKALPRKRKR